MLEVWFGMGRIDFVFVFFAFVEAIGSILAVFWAEFYVHFVSIYLCVMFMPNWQKNNFYDFLSIIGYLKYVFRSLF